jgi:hypothetical protein
MWKDPIVEEIHQIREQIAQQHGNDLHALVKYFQEREKRSDRQVLSFQPKRPAGWTGGASPTPSAL